MHSTSWIAFGVLGAIAVACGGSVSLGDIPADGGPGAADSGGADGAIPCASTAECGPAPFSVAITCADGSVGGNTGRCLKVATGCAWEIRQCPVDGCFDAASVAAKLRKCATASDCVVVDYQSDCCGNTHAAGVASSSQITVADCAATRAAAFPQCGCPVGPKTADDGSTDPGGVGSPTTPAVTCNASGLCETSYKTTVCGTTTCTPTQQCCSGMPFSQPTCVDGMACPISQRKYKKDITYLEDADRERLREELLRFPLATYRYKSESSSDREHLGFIIDDITPSPAVMQSGERVDMYGYQTMAVATLQVQARELAALRRELDELKATCAAKKK